MELSERIRSFDYLGDLMSRYSGDDPAPEFLVIKNAAAQAAFNNPWFTTDNITLAINSLGKAMSSGQFHRWLHPYQDRIENQKTQKTVGVVMAGNIPLVGFHDFLCVLMSGNRILARLSADDALLLPALARLLINYNPLWSSRIEFTRGTLENFDAILATGSNNTGRYFEYYFIKYPHIIRHNRNSIGIIQGNETVPELEQLAGDIMLYFGLGCRSVSRLFVPEKYDFTLLIRALSRYNEVINHHKYFNNYCYNKSMFLLNQVPAIDTGFLLLTENRDCFSRIAVLHYTYYNSIEDVKEEISALSANIQCVVSAFLDVRGAVRPGGAQFPGLEDYADNIDTMNFLLEL